MHTPQIHPCCSVFSFEIVLKKVIRWVVALCLFCLRYISGILPRMYQWSIVSIPSVVTHVFSFKNQIPRAYPWKLRLAFVRQKWKKEVCRQFFALLENYKFTSFRKSTPHYIINWFRLMYKSNRVIFSPWSHTEVGRRSSRSIHEWGPLE